MSSRATDPSLDSRSRSDRFAERAAEASPASTVWGYFFDSRFFAFQFRIKNHMSK